jgi:hypothetical protein
MPFDFRRVRESREPPLAPWEVRWCWRVQYGTSRRLPLRRGPQTGHDDHHTGAAEQQLIEDVHGCSPFSVLGRFSLLARPLLVVRCVTAFEEVEETPQKTRSHH